MKISRKKLMFYARDELTPKIYFWALRFNEKASVFCNACIRDCLHYTETEPHDISVPPNFSADRVIQWFWIRGKSIATTMPITAAEKARGSYTKAFEESAKIAKDAWEKLQRGLKPRRLYIQVTELDSTFKADAAQLSTAEKIRRIAKVLATTPNHVINEMIAGSIYGLETNNQRFVASMMHDFRVQFVVPRYQQIQSEQKEAEHIDIYSDIPQEIKNDGWAMTFLSEVSQSHKQQICSALRKNLPPEEGLKQIRQEDRWKQFPRYIEQINRIYCNPAFSDLQDHHPLKEKQLWKAITEALAEYWCDRQALTGSKITSIDRIEQEMQILSPNDLQRLSRSLSRLLKSHVKQNGK